MNEDDLPPNINQDMDYTTIFADGVIVKVDANFVCRLIFYQTPYDVNSNELKEGDRKNLLFEVRLPMTQFINLYDILDKFKKQAKIATIRPDVIEDEKTSKIWAETTKELYKLFLDTNDPEKDSDDYQAKRNYLLNKLFKKLDEEEGKTNNDE